MTKKREFKKLKANQYKCLIWYFIICLFIFVTSILFRGVMGNKLFGWIIVTTSIGLLSATALTFESKEKRKYSRLIEKYIRSNNLYQYTFAKRGNEKITYYPDIGYKISENNLFLRFRLDGTEIGQKLRGLEQSLADMLSTVVTGIIEQRGYITYVFEIVAPGQMIISSKVDIPDIGEGKIALTPDIIWNWLYKTYHCLIIGLTGSGKSFLVQYIISCQLQQNVKVIYCDPKNDDAMRKFALSNPSLIYATDENHIAELVKETELKIRTRESTSNYEPIYLYFDELIAYSKITSKQTFREVSDLLGAMVVTGRSKTIFIGLILQRPDTIFIDGAIRDNLGCRIAMGSDMSETAYTMCFGTEHKSVKNRRTEIGSGLIYRQGIDTKPIEFVAPYIKDEGMNK